MAVISWDGYLRRVKEIWGDRYKYSYEPSGEFKYKESTLKIICSHSSHRPNYSTLLYPPSHLRNDKHCSPTGCKECSRFEKNLIAWGKFLLQAKELWNDKYRYECKNPKEFSKKDSWVRIICNDDRHEPGFQTDRLASSHIRKNAKSSGCEECLRIERNIHSLDDFLVEAKEIWGDKYRYEYENPQEFDRRNGWVTIICNDYRHKENETTRLHPCNHVTRNKHRNPSGCRACFLIHDSKIKQKPFAKFLEDARAVHGEKYDYIEETYDGAKANMSIICNIHKKVFSQCPDSHINGGRGCPDCGKNKILTTSRDWRLEKVRERLHARSQGNVVVVEESFVSWHSEANFICSEHGEYRDYAFNVLTRGYPCQECNESWVPLKLTKEDILDRFKEKTGNFEILQIKGFGGDAELTIRCHDCSRKDFTVKMANTYTKDYACGVCERQKSEEYRKSQIRRYIKNSIDKRFRHWLKRAIEFHDDKYDYSLVNFISSHDKIEIICPSHGKFWQTPTNHLKSECRKCADGKLHGLYSDTFFERFPEKRLVPAILYYIKIDHDNHSFYKIGITKNSIKHRFGSASKSGFNITPIAIRETTLFDAFEAEQELLASLLDPILLLDDEHLVKALRNSTIGTTEVFSDSLTDSLIKKYFNDNN